MAPPVTVEQLQELWTTIATKRTVRISIAFVLVTTLFPVVYNGVVTGSPSTFQNYSNDTRLETADSLTVVTTHAGSGGDTGAVSVFDDNGQLVYQNQTHDRYYDVDPIGSSRTVIYIAQDDVPPSDCGLRHGSLQSCVTQVIERLNVTTGETETIYETSFFVAGGQDGWHDVDRLDEDRYLVANLFEDRAYILNTSTELSEWEWAADRDFPLTSGGPNKADWAHLNDADLIDNRTVMLSLRNHDQVVFVDLKTGLEQNRTLGSDNEYETLYEQHNPDYIPAERGGPAVLVADSQNNRVVEYQRDVSEEEWNRTWTYAGDLAWPRDADRLPSGNTLITDTHNNRVIEVNQSNDIVWNATTLFPYDAERLGTGKGSSGGQSASELNLHDKPPASATGTAGGSPLRTVNLYLDAYVPAKIQHGILWVFPGWMTTLDIALIIFSIIVTILWLSLELRWLNRVSLQLPVNFIPNSDNDG